MTRLEAYVKDKGRKASKRQSLVYIHYVTHVVILLRVLRQVDVVQVLEHHDSLVHDCNFYKI